MACPHGNGPPVACSQCLGVPATRVEQVGEALYFGDMTRPIEPTPPRNGLAAAIKGGRERALRSAPRTKRV